MRFVLIVLLLSTVARSQPIVYPLHAGDKWVFTYAPLSGGGTFSKVAVGDTAMPNGKTYTRILYDDNTTQEYVRQSGDSVYFYYWYLNKEVLFFDFSRPVGDTVSCSTIGQDTMDIVLASVFAFSIFGNSRREWTFSVNPIRHAVDVQYSLKVADSLGVTGKYPSFGDYYSLAGAVIDERVYGTILSIHPTESILPSGYHLWQNYPNPFNPTTTIRYALPQRADVTLTVFNTLGQHVATLVDVVQDAGNHDVRFDGSGLASGVYFYRLRAGEYVEAKRLFLIK